MTIEDVIIIGGGPAGMSAALNLLRSGKKVLIIEKENFGGKIAKAPCVENFPAFEKISGIDFTNIFFNQIKKLGVNFEIDEVLKVEKKNNLFYITTVSNNKYCSKSVIIAVGTQKRELNLNEKKFIGKGVSYCAICDGIFYKNKDVCVIGDGNTALQYAIYLAGFCKKVYLCAFSNIFRADNILVERIKNIKNIFIKYNFLTKKLIGTSKLEKIVFLNKKNNKLEEIFVSCLFIAIGQIPNNDVYANLVDLKDNFILVNNKLETKTTGLYAIGDCIVKEVRQLITATSDGSIAAFFVNSYLSKFQ